VTAAGTPTIGVLAGLGPRAGAHFYNRFVTLTPARADEEHPRTILVSDPKVPSRLAYFRGLGPSPAPRLRELAQMLVSVGADVLVLTSVTTHAHLDEIAAAVDVPVVNALAATAEALATAGRSRPAFLVTRACAEMRLLDKYLPESMEPLYPDSATQDTIDTVVEDTKRGVAVAELRQRLTALAARPWADQRDCLVVACTDLAPVAPLASDVVNIADVLARAVLAQLGFSNDFTTVGAG
jgi:aspartate racemase